MGQQFAVWTDRVESKVVRESTGSGPWRRRLMAHLTHRPMAWVERVLIRRAQLGLFHGRETFETYAPYCRQPEVVHDIHIDKADHISQSVLDEKIAGASGGALKVCYVGRMDSMKGPLDWIAVIEQLVTQGIDIQATWLGVGEMEAEVRSEVNRRGLADRISLPGFVTDRGVVLDTMRDAHIFLFCHKTPESPRCLIEALISGCPIVGYGSAFPKDLVAEHGGGAFVQSHDVHGLAQVVEGLATNRAQLRDLIARAARDGAPFDDVSVFRHRSEIIRKYL